MNETVRKKILDLTVNNFGLEHEYTIEIFKVSERLPEEEFDATVWALFLYRFRENALDSEPDYDEMAQEYEEQEATDLGFNPYLGCYDFDC